MASKSPRIALHLLVGLTGLVLAAQLLLTIWPAVGVYVNTITFVILLAFAVRRPALRSFTLLLAVIPVVAWISLIIATDIPRLFATYGILLALGITFKRQVSFRRDILPHVPHISPRHYLIALGVGVILGGLSLAIPHTHPITTLPLVVALPACVVFAFAEELYVRGLIQQQVSQYVSANFAILLAAAAGLCLSAGQGSVWLILLALISHGILSVLYRFIPRLALTTLANSTMKILWVVAASFTIH